jgi:hypothetical protein
MMKKAGTLIIIVGIGIFVLTGFTSFGRNKVVDVEKTEIIKTKPHNTHWYPLVGIAVLGIGALVLGQSSEK